MAQALDTAVAPFTPHDFNDADGPDTITLAVSDMTCGACISAVESALQAVPGVVSARANLSARRITVRCDHDRVRSDDLIAALAAVGYRAAELALTPAAEAAARDGELLQRLGVAGFAAMNIMLLSVSVWAGDSGEMDQSIKTLFHWLSALIALPAVAYAGQPFFRSAAAALRVRRLNMDVPISLGVILATLMSLFQTARGSEQVYFDAAVTLLAFLLAGRLLDQQMRTRAVGAAANLLGLKVPSVSVVREDGSIDRIPTRTIVPGMRVLAAAGERIAADGIVRDGMSEIDESLITGETAPKRVEPGHRVFAGTLNLSGPLAIDATVADDNTLVAEIGRLMEVAEQGRGRYVRLADRAARLYAPAVHVLGLSTFLGWMVAGQGWEASLTAAIAVLIITCPCALALAVPAVQVAASGRLFSKGIILKAADGLERLAEVDTVVLDKTGTLTVGEPVLVDADRVTPDLLLNAAALAANSRHPYARALVATAGSRGLPVALSEGVRETPGFGLSRETSLGEERLGSAVWCGAGESQTSTSEIWYRPGAGKPVAFRFEDELRPDAPDVIGRFKRAGLWVELVSGDRSEVVERVARAAGMERWLGSQAPRDKIARLEQLKSEGRRTLMVGDGLNDAPALAAAHASVSPATAADISQTAADAIFQGRRLGPVVEVLAVAKAARRLAHQNFAIAVGYNIIFVPLAMAGLVTPLIAAVAMSASSITVTANAVRLKSRHLELRS